MTPTAITQVLTTLEQAETVLNLSQSVDPDFLTEAEAARIDRIRARYRYHRNSGHLAEGVVNLVVVSPLLELAGFYDPPFQLRAECSVSLDLESVSAELEGRRLQGRLDFLVVQEGLWLGVVESKGTEFNVEEGIPQVLAYMYASPRSIEHDRPIYGMVTNGGQFLFVKLLRPGNTRTVAQYDISPLFSHLPVRYQLYDVAKVLKHLATVL
ncbi:MAG: type I restriction endonuclease subunit R [Prochlorothrix sp.]